MSDSANAPRFFPKGIKPTDEQTAIQIARKRIILVDANAGAAKTTTLALRVAESLQRGAPPENIAVVMFTSAAKQAMWNRLSEIGVAKAAISRMTIETFDVLARKSLDKIEGGKANHITTYKGLRQFVVDAQRSMLARYGDAYSLDSNESNAAVTQFLKLQLRTKARMEFYSEGFSSEESHERPLDERLSGIGMSLANFLWIQEYERIRGAHIQQVVFRGHLDSTYDLVRLLEEEPYLTELLPKFPIIIADELHDLNEVTFRFLTALIKRSAAFFCGAGDKDQVIYTWSGADHQFLRSRFQSIFLNHETFPLTATFRYGAHLAEIIATFKDKENKSALLKPTEVLHTRYDHADPDSCGHQVVGAVRAWATSGNKLGGVAILLRDRHQSIRIENALFQADLPYSFVSMRSFLAQKEVLMMRGMLAIACKDLASVHSSERRADILEALIDYAEVPFTTSEMREAKQDISEFPDLLEGFITNHILKSKNEAKSDATFSTIRHIQSLASDTPAADALLAVAELMQIVQTARRLYVDPERADVVIRSINGFIDVCRESQQTLGSFASWLGRMERSVSNAKLRDTILIACIDQVKGLEFEHVIIPYLARNEFPKPFAGLLEEENRLYVAATRAIRRLTLISPRELDFESSFIAKMEIDRSIARGERAMRKTLVRSEVSARGFP